MTANRRPAPSEGSTPLPVSSPAVTNEQATSCSRRPGLPEGGSTYTAILAGSVVPFQPNGSLKPTAMDSDPSEPAVSLETVNRRMSSDTSGPVIDKPDGTTTHAQVTNACLPAGQRPNKPPTFISGVRDTCSFLAWLRAYCPGGLSTQLKAEKLMVVPSTANRFRAVVSALRSLDGGGGCEFPHLHAPGGPLCVAPGEKPGHGHAWERRPGGTRFPGHSCPGSHAAAFRPSRPGPNQGPSSHPPPLHCIGGGDWGVQSSISHLTLRPASVGGDVRGSKRSIAMQALPTLRLHAAKLRVRAPVHRVWGLLPLQCCGCGGNHTANYHGCIKWKEAKTALAKRVPDGVRKSAATGHSAAPNAQWAGTSAEQMDLGDGWNHVVRGGRVVKATTTPPPNPKPSPQPVTEAPTLRFLRSEEAG